MFNEYLGKQTELYVAGTRDNEKNEARNYQLNSVLNKGRFRYLNPFVLTEIISLIRKKRIETILIEHPYLGWYIPFIRLFTRCKIICHTHNVESERFRSIGKSWWRILRFYERWVLNKCDLVFCITEEDKIFFMQSMNLQEEKCILVPYGITNASYPEDKEECKRQVCEKHGIKPGETLLFFNGVLNYNPNLEAVNIILSEIMPALENLSFSYHIIISGKNLPASYQKTIETAKNRIHYVGFVDDISLYLKAADILINPILSGGGVKTKLIESIASNTTVVSTVTGAIGVNTDIAGEKLKIINDGDWNNFAKEIKRTTENIQHNTPGTFYNEYNWDHIIKRLLPFL